MSNIYEMKRATEEIESLASQLSSNLDDVEYAVDQWEELGCDYSDAEEVKAAIAQGEEWVEFGESIALGPDEAASHLESLIEIVRSVEKASGLWVLDGTNDVEEALDEIRKKGNNTDSEVLTAIQMLMGALHRAGVLAGTVSVPTAVDDGTPPVSANTDTDNGASANTRS